MIHVVDHARNVEMSLAQQSRDIPPHLYSFLKCTGGLRARHLYLEDISI